MDFKANSIVVFALLSFFRFFYFGSGTKKASDLCCAVWKLEAKTNNGVRIAATAGFLAAQVGGGTTHWCVME